ncbi:MAG: DUF86 domain-containing protein [Nitrospirota bacterium]
MNLNVERILGNFNDIDEALGQLTKLKSISKEDFMKSMEYRYIAYAGFIILTEAIIDICYHISAKRLRKVPPLYAECFELLKENGILDPLIANMLSDMARFRNLLIHRYKKVDFDKIYDYISEDFWVIDKFKEKIKFLMKAES